MELSLVPTDDLLNEIMQRHEHAIFAGMQILGGEDRRYLTRRKWVGNGATCQGLCAELGWKIAKTADEEAEPAGVDE